MVFVFVDPAKKARPLVACTLRGFAGSTLRVEGPKNKISSRTVVCD